MQRYYSQSTGTTYLENVHTNMPADAKPISEERYLQAIAYADLSQVRTHDEEGLPILVNAQPPSAEQYLQEQHALQYVAVDQACEQAITQGFWSEALGARYFYTSQLDDQVNLASAIAAGAETLFACRDEAEDKEYRLHTYAQIRQVGDDFNAIKLQLLLKANTLKKQLESALAAGDLAALQAVAWEA